MWGRASLSHWSIVALLCISIASSFAYRIIGPDGRAWQSAINNDGKGYYEYLRAPLVEGPGAKDHGEDWMFASAGGGKVIKYFVGTALFQAPFVLAAHAYTMWFADGPEDGYSIQYHLAIILSAWVSLLLGLLFTRRLLLDLGFVDTVVAWILVAITLGTGLLVQVVIHPGMSHVHSFSAIAASMLFLRRSLWNGSVRHHIIAGALLGLVFILRPVDLLVLVALPLILFGSGPPRHRRPGHGIFAACLAFLCVASVQAFAWRYQCGEWIIRPYAGEGFHWGRPAFLEHLFSARNGLLFYWPVILLVPVGMIGLYRRSRMATLSLLLFLLSFGYVTSAWWNWSYGDAFGQRPYVDVLALLAIPMAAAFGTGAATARTGLLIVAAMFTLLNLFQSWQYATGILDPAQMTSEKYATILFRTDPSAGASLGGIHDLPPYAPRGMTTVLDTTEMWRPNGSSFLQWSIPEAPSTIRNWYVELDLYRIRLTNDPAPNDTLVLSGNSDWWPRNGIPFNLEQVPHDERIAVLWRNSLRIPPQEEGDTIRLWHLGAGAFRIDSVHIRIRAPR